MMTTCEKCSAQVDATSLNWCDTFGGAICDACVAGEGAQVTPEATTPEPLPIIDPDPVSTDAIFEALTQGLELDQEPERVPNPDPENLRPGSPLAASQELARRAHNKRVKKTGQGERQEAASTWAFEASSKELTAIVDQGTTIPNG